MIDSVCSDWHVHVHRQQSRRQLNTDHDIAAPGPIDTAGGESGLNASILAYTYMG